METQTPESEINRSTDFTRYGIVGVPKRTVTTALGKTKTFASLPRRELLFLLISTLNILTAIALTLYRLITVDPASSDFTFAILLLINAGFCLFYVFHGVLREKLYEVYAFIAAIIVVTVYCIVEYAFLNVDGRTTVKLVRLIVACVAAPPNIYLAWIVAKEFGFLEFKTVGASEQYQNMYRLVSSFFTLLKFDLQVSISIVVLALKEGTSMEIAEKVSLGIGIPYSLIWGVLGLLFVEKEMKAATVVFALVGLAKPTYYIYKIVRVYIELEDKSVDTSDTIVYSLLAAGALALLVWMLLMAELGVIYRNYGKGLKEKAFHNVPSERTSLLTGQRT